MPKSRRDKRRLAMLKNSKGGIHFECPIGTLPTQGSREPLANRKEVKRLLELYPGWQGTTSILRRHCLAYIAQAAADTRGLSPSPRSSTGEEQVGSGK